MTNPRRPLNDSPATTDQESLATDREHYTPGPAGGARVLNHGGKLGQPDGSNYHQADVSSGDNWTLVLVRDLRHAPEKVWRALTEPAHLREWAPFDADGNLGIMGATVNLSTVGSPKPHVSETKVTRADAPKVLEYTWGDYDTRWELEARESGTRLTLWTRIDRRYIAMGAAGWHICFDVLERLLNGTPIGRIAGMDAMKFDGWRRLHAEYASQFGTESN